MSIPLDATAAQAKPKLQSPIKPPVILPETYLEQVFGSVVTNPESASEAARLCFSALDDGVADRRLAKWLLALDSVTKGDIPVLFAKIKSDDKLGRGLDKEWEAFIQKWGEVDPSGGLNFADTHKDDFSRAWAHGMVLRGWARRDPQAAVAWLNGQSSMPKWEKVCGNLFKGITEKDPLLASAALVKTPINLDWARNQIVEMIGDSLVRRGSAEAVRQWYDGLPSNSAYEQQLKAAAMKETVKYLPKVSIDMAAEWLGTQTEGRWRPTEPFEKVADELAKTDPGRSLTWLSKVSSGNDLLAAGKIRQIFQNWKKSDPAKAQTWLQSHPDTNFVAKVSSR